MSLRFFSNVPWLALSATLTPVKIHHVGKVLGFRNVKTISKSINRPNIFLDIRKKLPNTNLLKCISSVVDPILDELESLQHNFPVSLVFMPHSWMDYAVSEAEIRFGYAQVPNVIWSIYTSNIDGSIKKFVTDQLGREVPSLRLIFTSTALSMGVNSPCITRVIHCTPPRNLTDFVQEFGRCGRKEQPSESIMYYNNNDLGRQNMDEDIIEYCRSKSCLRKLLLKSFGFETEDAIFFERCCCNC